MSAGAAGRAPDGARALGGELPVLLIGPRAAGKSALGRRLAAHLGWEFFDADEELVRRSGRPIADWLAADEPGFRRLEAVVLAELACQPQAVVALGGGVVETPAARELLAGHPRVLALLAPAGELAERLRRAPRPPLTDRPLEEEVRLLLERRRGWYAEAAGGRFVDTGADEEESWSRLLGAVAGLAKESSKGGGPDP